MKIIEIFVSCFITGLICFFIGSFFTFNEINKRPKALDVYRGKTTLEITYRDSVAIDSVVVYKMK